MSSALPGVLCFGNLAIDTLVRPVPDTPPWNASHWVESIEQHLGGNGANTAYAIARFGVPARLVGTAGRDSFGDHAVSILANVGVDVSGVTRSALPTPATVALVRDDGARSLLHCPGASLEAFAEPVDITPALANGCSRFHLANPFSVPGLRRSAPEILRRARASGLATSTDAGWDSRGEWMQVLGPCLRFTDLLLVNCDEARRLTGEEALADAAAVFLESGVQCVVIKLGEGGCSWHTAEDSGEASGFAVNAIDTTGAGDCFAGGFLAALQRGLPVPDAARVANAAGALSAAALGSVAGLRPWKETLEWAARLG